MVTKMRKKIHSLLGIKKQSTGALERGETRTLGAKNGIKSLKKAQFYDIKCKKKKKKKKKKVCRGLWVGG